MPCRLTFVDNIEVHIANGSDDVFLPREFFHLGRRSQVYRTLQLLVGQGKLIRLGQGVYARTMISSITGKPILAAPGGFISAARCALDKLGVSWEPGKWELLYNAGRTTQVPVNPIACIKKEVRFTRRLRYKDIELRVERSNTFA